MKKLFTFDDKNIDLQFQEIVGSLSNLQIFATNAAALAGGLKPGQFYRTGADPDLVCVVH
jgi:hypothetical protein